MINQELTLIIEVLVVIQDLKLVVIMHLAEVIIYLDLHPIHQDLLQSLDPVLPQDLHLVLVEEHLKVHHLEQLFELTRRSHITDDIAAPY